MEKNSEYGTGYDPEALEHDLRLISRLMHGKKQLTLQLAQEIYYKIRANNIIFQSSKGEAFWEQILHSTTEAQRMQIDEKLLVRKRRRCNTKRLLNLNRKIAVVVSVTILLFCIVFLNWNLLLDLRTNYQTNKLQDKIRVTADINNVKEPLDDTEEAGVPPSMEDAQEQKGPAILSKFTALYEENNDFSGWLSIEGTKINYPVMSKEGDNDYYLDKNFNRQEDKNGLLILDYRSNVLESGQNIIIYGHNMRTGVMFGTLKNYKDKDYCLKHQTIQFDSLYEEGVYRVVAAMLSEVAYEDEDVFRYYDAIDISTKERFDEFQQNIEQSALYTTEERLEYGDSCLILSTCDYYTQDGRFVVIAKKIN